MRRDTMSEKLNIPQLFLETIRKEMVFLTDEYGFNGPYSDFGSEDRKYVYRVWFTGKSLAAEFVLDWRDQDVSCYIVRLEDGRFPEGWKVNERGQRIRVDLWSWVRERGIHLDPLFTKGKNGKRRLRRVLLEEQIAVLIPHYAFLLRAYGQPILEEQVEEVFGL